MPKLVMTLAFLFSLCICAFLADAQLNLTAAQGTEAPQTGTLEQTIPGHY